jgi:predicted glycoside hydrolase/deacetylase ChbG (UPF0249 family)
VSDWMKKRRILVTGDDLGYCRCRNEGMLTCVAAHGGSMTSCSVLVTFDGAVDAARKESLGGVGRLLSLGLHLNLTEGSPLVGGPSLVDGMHGFYNKHELRARCDAGLVNADEIERETRAQIVKFEELFGQRPAHVDGHQHVHLITLIAPIVARVMSELQILRTRIPRELVTSAEHPW